MGGQVQGNRIVIEGACVATMDGAGSEYASGHVVLEGNRIVAVGAGSAPDAQHGDVVVAPQDEASRLLVTPGLVNCHHHMYQHLTRGRAQECNLFEWLVELYPTWALLDDELQAAASRAAMTALLVSGCTTSTDHHYLHPKSAGDMLAIQIEAATELGLRFHPCRGSMDLGEADGGLPPESCTEDTDEVLVATEEAIRRWHDPSFDSMLRIAVAPCSPFNASRRLFDEGAQLARRYGVRMHTHLAETIEEEAYCQERFGCRPVQYLEDLGWLGDDVWLAHCVHLDDHEVRRFGETGTGVAHCPSSNARLGAGIARVRDLVDAGAPVGLGVDGAASNESGELSVEVREALLMARLRTGEKSMTARQSLELGTIHGARCLGRQDEIGSIEVGKVADLAVWEVGGVDVATAGIEDPVAALVFGPPRRARDLFVQGRRVVNEGLLTTGSHRDIARELARACTSLASRAALARG